MNLDRIGERRIIEIILEQLDQMPEMPIPFGDDVSAFKIDNNQLVILKTDMLVDKTDVPPEMSLWQAARKAVIMNVSDFASKGVQPKVMLVSLGLPKTLTVDDVKEIGRGLNAGAREYNAYVIGGDTGEASDLVISLSTFGLAKKGEVILRRGARPGNLVAVTGPFGKSTAGLKLLLEALKVTPEIRNTLIKAVLLPCARLKEGLALSKTKAVTAAIDSSDGLAWSLHEIAKASNVGFLIKNIPTTNVVKKFAEMNKLDLIDLTLYGGEEYELILTIDPSSWNFAEKAVEKYGVNLLPIGEVTERKEVYLELNGKRTIIEKRGWEHFTIDNV